MPKVKRYLPSSSLGKYLRKKVYTQVNTFEGIYLFTNRVITHFGSKFCRYASRENVKTFQ